ncbi:MULTISPECIES: VOC family protein [Vibrio]|uniref:VOC family protein n=1 Tax=Vibrio TaxID=662 RepID=UPI0008043BAF|nr:MULTISPECIES: VOC family protein [Vibrio]ANQ26533.1 lactoylglutathione lyase [Vibrio natriegens]AXT71052.1 VOC family protein [Vibrio sp. dhg]
MIDHFEIKVVDFENCRDFYQHALSPLGIELKWADDSAAGFGLTTEPNVRFLIEKGDNNAKSHIAFSALNKEQVIEFHQAGLTHGASCNGKPGLRKKYAANYYAAFLLDPDGNNVEAVVYL